jgi:putative FmdB family regulatory protein
MPTYEYQCQACSHEMEAFQSIKDAPLKECPKCHELKLERLISGGTFHLKGGGWYKDLYSSSKPASTSTGTADKSEKLASTIADANKKSDKVA